MSSYRALLARPGARRIALSAGIGWLAFGGYGLGLVLAVHHATDSFAVAGIASGVFAAGSALLAPVRGALVDRRGARGLLSLAAIHTAALASLIIACAPESAPQALLVAAAGAAGGSAPPLAATSRVVWARVAGPDLVRAAHALNATLGEAAAVVSPIAVSSIAAVTSPVIAAAILIPGIGTAALGLAGAVAAPVAADPKPPGCDRSRGHGANHSHGRRFALVRDSPGLRWLMVGDVVSGLWLAGLEVAAAAIAVDAGNLALAGLPLLGLAVGGISAALWTGTRRGGAAPQSRLVWGACGAALVLPLTVVLPGIAALAVLSTLAGVALGLTNVALFELVDHVADESRAVEAFTWITSAQASGLAIGAAVAGALAATTPEHALYVVAAAPAFAAAGAIYARGRGYFQVAV